MGRPFRHSSAESHDWAARADQEAALLADVENGPQRVEAERKIDLLRIAADMKRLLTRPQS